MNAIVAHSPAKLNLFLHVHQQRADGFHNLQTYFQLIDLCDVIHFSQTDKATITVDNPSIDGPMQADLCYRAAELLRPYAESRAGVSIAVNKRIPAGGGLGGGSSNAATVLKVLNRLWNIHLPQKKLLALALELGSDVPIFIHGHSSYARGRGEVFTDHLAANLFERQLFCLIKPNCHVATAEIFQSPLLKKRPGGEQPPQLDTVLFENDFEPVVFSRYPAIADIAEQLAPITPVHLTGTGACLYGLIDNAEQFKRIRESLDRQHDCFLVRGIAHSP